jgi:hypothetical protein
LHSARCSSARLSYNRFVWITPRSSCGDGSIPRILSGWYDVSIRVGGDPAYLRRIAGRVQGHSRELKTDPAVGNVYLFKPSFSIQKTADHSLRLD